MGKPIQDQQLETVQSGLGITCARFLCGSRLELEIVQQAVGQLPWRQNLVLPFTAMNRLCHSYLFWLIN